MENRVNNKEADSDGEQADDGELMDRSGTNRTSVDVRLQFNKSSVLELNGFRAEKWAHWGRRQCTDGGLGFIRCKSHYLHSE
jgi:hypothetical protein